MIRKKVKIGFYLPNWTFDNTFNFNSLFLFGEKADRMGFDFLTVQDHIVWWHQTLDPTVAMSYLAARTKKIKLCATGFVLPYYHPVLLAKAFATLDLISGGRTLFGVVPGYNQAEFDATGVPFRERGERLAENLRLIRRLWTADNVTYSGKFRTVHNVTLDIKPVQKPHPPIWIGAAYKGLSHSALRRVAELGDGWISLFSPPEQFKERWDLVLKYRKELKKPLERFQGAMVTMSCLGSSRERAHKTTRDFYLKMYGKYADYHTPSIIEGSINGTPADCIKDLEKLAAVGCTNFFLVLTHRDKMAQLELFSEEIMPHFAK